jgi:AraC-like DNA-binding protein
MVPPHCAIWIPGGATHAIKASGDVEGYDIFLDPALTADLPQGCCTVSVTPLLRELLVRAAGLPLYHDEAGATGHLIALLLAEIAAAPMERLHLPMPEDKRLRQIAEAIVADPSDRGTIASWARHAALSERTLARLLKQETGMSFGRWRQQLAIMIALRRMAEGASIQRVAADLGYESTGSFVTMFRKALGAAPARYMATMRGRASGPVEAVWG